MSSGTTTTNHDEIRKWAEKRGGRPTVVKGTEGKDGEGILRIDFREPDEKLEEIPWNESSRPSRIASWPSSTRTRPPMARKAAFSSS